MSLDDAEIMRRVQNGQLALFDELVLRYRKPLLHAAWSKLGNQAWAEDVVQEAFLAAYAARRTFKPEFSFRTWLWTILLNLCRRQWKRSGMSRNDVSFESCNNPSNFTEPASSESGLTLLLELEERVLLHKFLTALPEVQADALRLRFFGELKFKEIAEAMDSSVSSAKIRVRKGLQTLSELFRDFYQGDSA